MNKEQWGDVVRFSKIVDKKKGKKPNRLRVVDLMEESSDEDRLERLFGRSWLRDLREDFEDACAGSRTSNRIEINCMWIRWGAI